MNEWIIFTLADDHRLRFSSDFSSHGSCDVFSFSLPMYICVHVCVGVHVYMFMGVPEDNLVYNFSEALHL